MMGFGIRLRRAGAGTLAFARRPELLAFLPAVTLAAWWAGGEAALLVTALAVPLVYALAGLAGLAPAAVAAAPRLDPVTGLGQRDAVVRALDAALAGRGGGTPAACIVVGLDDADGLARLHGHAAFCEILGRTGARIAGATRRGGTVGRLDGAVFAVAVAPAGGIDLETALQTAAHIQDMVEVEVRLDDIAVPLRASVGLCLAGRATGPGGAALLEAAVVAMDAARLNGPGAIRAFAPDMRRRTLEIAELRRDLGPALDEGEVQAFFQPQISTCTHKVTGMETLVRWHHPARGLLAPADFLPGMLAAGLAERLGEVMLSGALRALHRWDRAGLEVPTVTVNFAPEELRNPRLPERVEWELDRFGLAPDRLVVDIPDALLAHPPDEMAQQTLLRLAALGLRIDLDALGGGHASLAALERFPVGRLKIARRFVTGLDGDAARQRTVAGLLALAERLDLDTLAVGVETPGDHAMLAQLGCAHVQGFAIARAMPEDAAASWIAAHTAGIGPPLRIGTPPRP